MNKKILIFGVLAVLMLVTISFASAVTIQTQITRKESPLYQIRTEIAIKNNVDELSSTYVGEDNTNVIFPESYVIDGEDTYQTPLNSMYFWFTNGCYPTSCNPSWCSRDVECFPSMILPACRDSLEYYVQDQESSQQYL